MTLRQFLNGVRYGSPDGPAIVVDWENRKVTYKRMSARRVLRMEHWRRRGDAEAGAVTHRRAE
jgi:hypothetical protein